MEYAGGVAPQREPRPIDNELLQAQIEKRQRGPGDNQVDLGQFEQWDRRSQCTVPHAETVNNQLRIPAVPTRRESVDLHRLSELTRQRIRQRVPVGLDPREHHKTHGKQQRAEQRKGDDCGNGAEPDKSDQRGGNREGDAGRGALGRHNSGGLSHCGAGFRPMGGHPFWVSPRSPRALSDFFVS